MQLPDRLETHLFGILIGFCLWFFQILFLTLIFKIMRRKKNRRRRISKTYTISRGGIRL